MQNRYVLILTILTFLTMIACRVRNHDRNRRKVKIKKRISRIMLFPVTIYDKTTIMSMIICISHEILLFFSLLAIYVIKLKRNTVCYFWGVLFVYFFIVSASGEAFFEMKNEEEKKKKVGYAVEAISFAIFSVVFLIMQLSEFVSRG